MNNSKTIPNQVELPLRIAFEVVIQGLRIRLGRSIVTITGVVCGIAFLISILTGQLIKKGVAEEDARREEVARIASFVRNDLPSLTDRTIALVGSGRLSEVEMRVLEELTRQNIASLLLPEGLTPSLSRTLRKSKAATATEALQQAGVIFVMGDGSIPNFAWQSFFDHSLNAMVALSRHEPAELGANLESRCVLLSRPLSEEELAEQAAEIRKDKFRNSWIVTISLLVTVIGIANAMLMSVTERFREIGTMKCLGALSSFVTRMFVLEASIIGLVGGVAGAIAGAIFALIAYSITYGGGLVFAALSFSTLLLYALFGVAAGVILSVVAAIYPARVAAGMVPAMALRSTV